MSDIIAATEFGPGHVWLIFDEQLSDDLSIYVMRESDTSNCLGPDGWQQQPYGITPISSKLAGMGTKFLLGPQFVDSVLDGEYVTVKAGNVEFFAFWPSVIAAAKKSNSAIVERIEREQASQSVPPVPTTPHISTEEPAANADNDAVLGRAPVDDSDDDVKKVVDAALSAQNAYVIDQHKTKKPLWPLVILGAVLWVAILGGGFFAYKTFLADKNTELPQAAASQTPPATEPEETAEREADASAPTQLDQDVASGPDGWSRLLNSADTDPQRLYDLGHALRSRENGDANIGFEAIYKAGQKGNRAALEWYARANDPTSDASGADRITPPNIRRAFESWSLLVRQDASMTTHIKQLCESLRERRYSGTNEERTTFQDYCQ
ncbi:hypothetical protein [Bartonella sp. LJL80]